MVINNGKTCEWTTYLFRKSSQIRVVFLLRLWELEYKMLRAKILPENVVHVWLITDIEVEEEDERPTTIISLNDVFHGEGHDILAFWSSTKRDVQCLSDRRSVYSGMNWRMNPHSFLAVCSSTTIIYLIIIQ